MLLLLPVFLIAFLGCNRLEIHPISEKDIKLLKSGENFSAPKDGAFLSNEYIEDVMKVKVKK